MVWSKKTFFREWKGNDAFEKAGKFEKRKDVLVIGDTFDRRRIILEYRKKVVRKTTRKRIRR